MALKRDKDSGKRAFVEPVILVASITRLENRKEEESLGYIGRHCLKANIKQKICVYECLICVYICSPEEGTRSYGTTVIDSSEPPCSC